MIVNNVKIDFVKDVKCNDKEEYIHPPVYREKMAVRIFIRSVWKVAFEQ